MKAAILFCCIFLHVLAIAQYGDAYHAPNTMALEKMRSDRMNAEMNRHYESIKPQTVSTFKSGSYGNASGGLQTVQNLFKTKKEYEREKAEKLAKERAAIAAYKNLEVKFIELVRERSDLIYIGDEENYRQYVAIAKQAGFNQMEIVNTLGTNSTQFVVYSNKPNSLLSKCYTSSLLNSENKSTYEKSVMYNNYMKSQKSAQDFNAYLKSQNSNDGFNTFKEKPILLQPLPSSTNNNTVTLQGLKLNIESTNSTLIFDSLYIDTARNNAKPVLKPLGLAKKETIILDALKLPSKNNNSQVSVLKPLNQTTNSPKTKNNSILESLKIKEAKPAKDNSIYKKLINLE